MPTVLRLDGFEFRVYIDDHAPAHVHAYLGRFEARIAIGDADSAPTVLSTGGMPAKPLLAALRIVEAHQAVFLGIWRKYHG